MGFFDDDDANEGRSDFGRHDYTLLDGTYVGHTLRHGAQIDAITPSEGYAGRYDADSDTTFDRAGVPIGRGNWLTSLFRRG